jgi:hypothetical protein
MTRRGIGIALAAALALGAPAAASASAQVAAPEVVIGAHLYPRPFGLTYIYGQLRVPDTTPASTVQGQTVALYASVFPFTAWTQVATLTTDFKGYYSYHATIAQNTAYHAVWQGASPLQSRDRLVKLPLRLRLHARRGSRGLVTFSGNAYPPHPGARVLIQRMNSHGRFRNLTSTTLLSSSRFTRRVRIKGRGGVFRALFAGDGQFGIGASRPLRVRLR